MSVFRPQEVLGYQADPPTADGEVLELALLLPAGQLARLESAARQEGLTVAQLVRSLIQDLLSGKPRPTPARRRPGRPREPAARPAAVPGPAARKRGPTSESCHDLEQWAAAFEAEAQALLGDRASGAGADGYAVRAARCGQHGPSCVCVTYGMLRGHYPWGRHDPWRLAEQLVRTMLPGRT
jgi:hypothetical protein